MAAGDVRKVLRSPGRLAYGCTDLTTAWPHGGTGLGATKGLVMMPLHELPFVVTAFEYGGRPVESYRAGEFYRFSCRLRGWDDNAIAAFYPNTETGSVSQHTGVAVLTTETTLPGRRESARQLKVVFTPDNTKDVPAMILYAAQPFVMSGETALQRKEERTIDVALDTYPDSTGRIYRANRLSDLAGVLT